jgi:glycosyltransferase involved in cell wall biosynthesis
MIGKYPLFLRGMLKNLFSNITSVKLTYIVSGRNWSIQQDGIAITRALNKSGLLKAKKSFTHFGARNQILHFGSVNSYFRGDVPPKIHSSNRVVVTWFHVVPNDSRLRKMKGAQKGIDRIHTSCNQTKETLIEAGVDKDKISVIPLGVDLNLFTSAVVAEKEKIRSSLGIPSDAFVIGSFQKDGVGWGEGVKPKLIKGPDVFVETVSRLKHLNPFVLLTGPARGYVKNGLKKNGIPFKHVSLKKFEEVARMFKALDLYIIASRVEGGPKAILEAWASGIPVMSTCVGMVPDIASHGENVMLSDIEDVESLAVQSSKIAEDESVRSLLISKGLARVQDFSWRSVAARYYNNIYKTLL